VDLSAKISKQMNKISIMGCGWLGLPLAEYLQLKGYQIKGSTTQVHKRDLLSSLQIEPYMIRLNPKPEGDNITHFFDTDCLILNIPPRSRRSDIPITFYPKQIQHLIPFLKNSTIKHVIFISSTSVYPKLSREIFEMDAVREAHSGVFDAEQILLNTSGIKTTILRCAGLAGGKRIPGRFFAGKKNLTIGEEPVNQVFRDDVIHVIAQIIRLNGLEGIYNLCAPKHPLKKDLYRQNAQLLGLELPEFIKSEAPTPYKIINSDKLQRILRFKFMYEDPFDFEYEI